MAETGSYYLSVHVTDSGFVISNLFQHVTPDIWRLYRRTDIPLPDHGWYEGTWKALPPWTERTGEVVWNHNRLHPGKWYACLEDAMLALLLKRKELWSKAYHEWTAEAYDADRLNSVMEIVAKGIEHV